MPRLTKRAVDGVEPSTRELFVWDTLLTGFGLRVFPTGRKTYFVQYRDTHGRTRRYTLGRHGVLTPDEARTLARQALARVQGGANPAEERQVTRHAPTVAALVERFRREHLPTLKPKTVRDYTYDLERYILPALGALPVTAVTRDAISALYHRLRETPYQANRVLSICSVLFACGEAWGLRPEGSNPARRLARYREHKRERYLTAEELGRLGRALAQADAARTERREAVALIRLLLLTGARLGEIRTLRWEWVDWERQHARLPDSKTGVKTVYLAPAALEVLRGLGVQAAGLVLPGLKPGQPMGHPQKVWRRLCQRAQLVGVRPHDLRHTYGSMGATLGLSLQVIGTLLGHTDTAMTQRYAHLAPDPVQQAAALVGEALAKALGG